MSLSYDTVKLNFKTSFIKLTKNLIQQLSAPIVANNKLFYTAAKAIGCINMKFSAKQVVHL